MPSVNFRILLVTDRHQIRDHSLPAVLEEAFSGGITAVQLRERYLSTRDLAMLARDVQVCSRRQRAQLIINDRIDLALALEVDGVHLRADSLSATIARRLLGPHRLIGVSTHSLADVHRANEEGADYVVFGPIFTTPSKKAFGAPLGLDALAAACAASRVPVLAIGGITRERIEPVRQRGAAGVAVIGALLSRHDVAAAARELRGEMDKEKY